jgi:MFS family permease
MQTVAVTFYNVVVWLHISAVLIAFGPTFAFGVYFAVGARKYPRSIPAILETQNVIQRSMTTIGGVLILITGFYLAGKSWDFSDFFIVWGIIAIIALMGLVHGFFLPNDTRALRIIKRDLDTAGPSGDFEPSKEFMDVSSRSARMGPIAGLIVILTIYVMAAKPFL